MKIVTWNCNGALRKKLEILKALEADLYVIQECENPETLLNDELYTTFSANSLWTGDIKSKGLGSFASNGIILNENKWPTNGLKYFISANVNGAFDLIAAWAHKANSPTFGYIGQLWKYLQFHIDKMQNTIIAGDLNSNVRWDRWDRWWNHSDVVRELSEVKIESLYHMLRKVAQGAELEPTFFLQRNREKAYHIDYIFASEILAKATKSLEIGNPDEWLAHSDHLPVIATLGSYGSQQDLPAALAAVP